MRILARIAAAVSMVLLGPAATAIGREPELTPMQIQALQSREFETTKEVLFAAVVSVFQDLGYQLENADMTSGFITASSPNQRRTNFGNILAMQRASGHTRATAFIEGMPNGRSRVRLNFLNTRSTSSVYGQHHERDRPVLDATTYNAAWERIDEAIFVRTATQGISPAPPRAATTPTPEQQQARPH